MPCSVVLFGELLSGGARAGVAGPEEAQTDGPAGELGSVGFVAIGVHDSARGHVRRPRDATQEVHHVLRELPKHHAIDRADKVRDDGPAPSFDDVTTVAVTVQDRHVILEALSWIARARPHNEGAEHRLSLRN